MTKMYSLYEFNASFNLGEVSFKPDVAEHNQFFQLLSLPHKNIVLHIVDHSKYDIMKTLKMVKPNQFDCKHLQSSDVMKLVLNLVENQKPFSLHFKKSDLHNGNVERFKTLHQQYMNGDFNEEEKREYILILDDMLSNGISVSSITFYIEYDNHTFPCEITASSVFSRQFLLPEDATFDVATRLFSELLSNLYPLLEMEIEPIPLRLQELITLTKN